MNEAGIRFLPLKGIVMKDFYPRYGMREMSDNDILCDSAKMPEVREIMESLGFSCETYGEWHHDTYHKPPSLCFEMHHSFCSEDSIPVLYGYYENVFDRAERKNGCEYALSDEDFYIWLLAHLYMHFSNRGSGLRPLLDIYVYLQMHSVLDFNYIGRELEKIRIARFEQRCRDLALRLFGFRKLGDEDKEMLLLFLNSPLYGTVSQGEYNKLTRRLDGKDTKSAKAKYIFDRVFLRGDDLKENYPFFAEHKWLLPALYVYRPVRGVLTRPKGIAHETKNLVKYKSPKIGRYTVLRRNKDDNCDPS